MGGVIGPVGISVGRRLLIWRWIAVWLLIGGAWIALFAMAMPLASLEGIATYGVDFWASICAVDPGNADIWVVLGMWLLMSAAMMIPTFVPVLSTYEHLTECGAANSRGFVELVCGYLLVWSAFSATAAAAQFILHDRVFDDAQSGRIFTSAMLAIAGIYQLSSFKAACLSRCKHPLTMFIKHWNSGRFDEFIIGIRFGIVCVACCSMLMLIALISGAMNLIWMGLATFLMIVEKNRIIGKLVTQPLAVALLVASALVATTIEF